jgi:hypothetical protein
MATKLLKNICRETSVDDGNGRLLIVTLNSETNEIEFKPKGRTAKAKVTMPMSKVYQLIKNAQTI